ncbi:MAG: disulfide bond formation protein B [Caulobacter sp.]|nr:disulfide bond formation protein B [Caulobacter sp.]
MKAYLDRLLANWPLVAALVSALMLAIAHAFETFGGLAPCTLCLKAREVYWVALTVGLGLFLAGRFITDDRVRRIGGLLLAVIFLVGVGVAVYHAGAEWKFWPGPQSCAAGGAGVNLDSLDAILKGAKIKPPACDEAAWVFLGLSMAGWNGLVSLGLTALSVMAVRRPRD